MSQWAWRAAFLAVCVSWSGDEERFLTITEYDAGHASRSGRRLSEWRGTLEPEEILVLVMASKGLQQRVTLIEEAWTHSRVQRRYVVDEWLDVVSRELQWRPSERAPASPPQAASDSYSEGCGGRRGGPIDEGYWDAQSRQLLFMSEHPEIVAGAGFKWIILADDDTFVNMDQLLSFVRQYDPSEPVLFTYVLSDAHVLAYDYPCGGAGMLLSGGAYSLLATRILSPVCPMLSFNDLTLGFCTHKLGIPMVHNHNFRCAPDLNRAMRSSDNMFDLQRGIAVHRLPGFVRFDDIVRHLEVMESQLEALLQHNCEVVARIRRGVLDSRRFFWTSAAFRDAVAACRGGEVGFLDDDSPLHLDILFFGRGVPVARYHKDRRIPRVAEPKDRAARWPEWLEQLRRLDCVGRGDTWKARWLDSKPRLSRRQLQASDLEELADGAKVSIESVKSSFDILEAESPRGSWLDELRQAERRHAASDASSSASRTPPGRRWLFVAFAAHTTFVNVFESLEVLRGLSAMYDPGGSGEEGAYYGEDIYGTVQIAARVPPPLALAYEYLDLNVEQDSGVWLNGVATQRLLRCPAMDHQIRLDGEAHANDWETEAERLSLLWHNALAVDIFRMLRFCGVLLLHTQQMVPHAMSYLPYTTNRRIHLSSLSAAMTVGNVVSREQMFSMGQLVRQRACRLARVRLQKQREADPNDARPKFEMRAVGGCSDLELSEREWLLPGARFLGQAMVAFRSEHFLPDAQAVGGNKAKF